MNDSTRKPRSPIAVVGVSALFPGSIDATGFWSNILEGTDLMSDVPATHWLVEDYYDPTPGTPDKTYAKRGAFLPAVDFDVMGWGVPPNIVSETDTSQLLALIVAQRVLADAARGGHAVDLARTSVILGVTSGQELLGSMVSRLQRPIWSKAMRDAGLPESEVVDVCDRIAAHYTDWNESTFPGLLGNVVAGRIANRLNLGGTNCVVDAACASTMSALSMGINELHLGDSDMVIAGGVDTMNDIFMFMCFSQTPALSPTGDCRPFSDQADGTMLAEGLGMVALKRLADAEAHGDRIYAVIRGCGASSDGRSKSVYAPVSKGQAECLRRTYDQAQYGPDTVELVEAHGTGTKAGDAAEFGGLMMVFEESGRTDRQWCQLGSVKSQMGHAKSAAGAAGLFKAVMALHHRVLPPTIKVERPNPELNLPESPFHLTTRSRPWVRNADHPRRASVSAFGFGGSNFHVALQEYRPTGGGRSARRLNANKAELVILAAHSAAEVARRAREETSRCAEVGHLKWLARQSEAGGAAFSHRLALVATDDADLAKKLGQAAGLIDARGEEPFATPNGIRYGVGGAPEGEVAFVFPGQGSQYVDMGAGVAMHFDAALRPWDQAADMDFGGERLHDVVFPKTLFADDADEELARRLAATEWAQPAIGCTSMSLLRLLEGVGLKAASVAGHSFGELTALHAAGVLDAEQLLRVARRRGELMAAAASEPGAMTAVSGTIEALKPQLEAWDIPVVVANHNAPNQVVLSGRTDAIEAVEAKLAAVGVKTKRLPVATAFHSEIVAGASDGLAEFLADVDFGAAAVPVFANMSAAPYPATAMAARKLLADQMTHPVRFVEMIEAMYAAGTRTFVEVGPGSVLSGLVGEILDGRPHRAVSLDRRGRDGVASLLEGLATLAADGHALNLAALWEGHAEPENPAERPKPKLTLELTGANYGKPYPPASAAELPGPNPERVVPQPVQPVAPAAPAASLVDAATPTSRLSAAPVGQYMPAPVVAAAGHVAGASPLVDPSWAAAWQQTQRQTAEAHTAYMDAMAQSHVAFLQTVEHGFGAFVGQPAAVDQPAALAVPVSQRPVAPVAVAPPQPMPVAPVAVAPVAPTPTAAAPIAPAAAPTLDLQALMLQVVSDKTGYPTEMLTMEMQLEVDLGIDSIKRVEILSAVQDGAPGLPQVDTTVLAKLHTLGEIVDHMQSLLGPASATAPVVAAPVTAAVAAAPTVDLQALMLQVVSDKTGYPTEMLTMEMQLEVDLGIDSIKRVEILSAVQDGAPGLPQVDTTVLAKLHTLGEIVDHMQGLLGPASATAPVVAAPVTAALAAPPTVDLQALMLQVVSDKTGYPTEMLTMEMQLEVDLGIDSIKRVEILSAVQDGAPGLPQVDTTVLAKLHTLGEIVDHMQSLLGPASAPTAPVSAPGSASAESASVDARLGRFVLTCQPQPARGLAMGGLAGSGRIAITSDGTDLAETLAALLRERGVPAEAVDTIPETDLAGLIFLGGLRALAAPNPIDAAVAINREGFAAAQSFAAAHAGGGLFVTVQDTGGTFATGACADHRAWSAGLAGLARSVDQEWPDVSVKAIDLERGDRSAAELAQAIADELLFGGPDLSIGLPCDGRRLALRSERVPVTPGRAALTDGDVVVASGGARGVTAATLVELAGVARLRFVLLGRTPLEAEPAGCAGASSDSDLKRVLLQQAMGRGETLNPAGLGRAAGRILAAREIRTTLAAIAAKGSQAEYLSVDVTDGDALAAALDTIRSPGNGAIAAIVHGAGVIHDKLLADKTLAQFDRVFDTKVAGLRALLDVTAHDPLKVLCLFSSVAGRCGNVGQSDYAMANEVLNKVAWAEARRRGPKYVVKSLGWGPWEGGMVTPQLKGHFERLGVPLIPLEVGARMLVDELASTQAAQVELVLGGEPRAEALAPSGETPSMTVGVTVDRHQHPYLRDHTIQGTPVVPVALVIEWFSRAARAFKPDLLLVGLNDIKVMRGIPLVEFETGHQRLQVHTRQASNGDGVVVGLELSDSAGQVLYRATAQMAHTRPAPGLATGHDLSLETWGDRAVYDGDVLFHGPNFQAIRSIDGISDKGMAAMMGGVVDAGWTAPWCTDALAFDGGLQLALLWSQRVLGGASLPTSIEEVRTFADQPITGDLRCTLTGRRAKGSRTVSDLVFHGTDGAVLAELRGVETHQRPRT